MCDDPEVEAAGEAAAAPRAMTVERTISDGGLRLREAYQQISNLELSLVQVSGSTLRADPMRLLKSNWVQNCTTCNPMTA